MTVVVTRISSAPRWGQGTLRRLEEDRVSSFDQYAQAEWQGERWTFSGGVRHSHVDFNVDDRYLSNGNDSGGVSYDKTTPTVAAMYRLTPAVNLYASAARGFEAPTFNEMFYSSGGGTFNFGLKPSTSTLRSGPESICRQRYPSGCGCLPDQDGQRDGGAVQQRWPYGLPERRPDDAAGSGSRPR
jgi:hypothetical protein